MENNDKLIRKCGQDWEYCSGMCKECNKAALKTYDNAASSFESKPVEIDLKDLFKALFPECNDSFASDFVTTRAKY